MLLVLVGARHYRELGKPGKSNLVPRARARMALTVSSIGPPPQIPGRIESTLNWKISHLLISPYG